MRVGYTIKHELVLAFIVSIIFILINTRTRGKCEAGNAFLSRCLQYVTTRNWSDKYVARIASRSIVDQIACQVFRFG